MSGGPGSAPAWAPRAARAPPAPPWPRRPPRAPTSPTSSARTSADRIFPDMTARLDARFNAIAAAERAALVTFVMAGDPDAATSAAILAGLPKAGADVIEIGMPFTDPMADGPAVQAAGLRALKAGMTLAKTLELVRGFRQGDNETP